MKYKVRNDLIDGKIGRVIFCAVGEHMALLYGFSKKTQKTLPQDLKLTQKLISKYFGLSSFAAWCGFSWTACAMAALLVRWSWAGQGI